MLNTKMIMYKKNRYPTKPLMHWIYRFLNLEDTRRFVIPNVCLRFFGLGLRVEEGF